MNGPISLEQIKIDRVAQIVYGKAGVGKTVYAHCSQYYPTFTLDIDNGMLSAACWKGNQYFPPVRKELVHIWPKITNLSEFMMAMNYLLQNIRNYGHVVLDTATELLKILMADLLKRGNKYTASPQEWGIVLKQLEDFARAFRALPINVTWLAHESVTAVNGIPTYTPAFQGASVREYAKHFDLIGRLHLLNQEFKNPDNSVYTTPVRLLQCLPDQYTDAKDRSNVLTMQEMPIIDNIIGRMLSATNPSVS